MPGNSGALFSASYLQEKPADQGAIELTGSPHGVRQWVRQWVTRRLVLGASGHLGRCGQGGQHSVPGLALALLAGQTWGNPCPWASVSPSVQ